MSHVFLGVDLCSPIALGDAATPRYCLAEPCIVLRDDFPQYGVLLQGRPDLQGGRRAGWGKREGWER